MPSHAVGEVFGQTFITLGIGNVEDGDEKQEGEKSCNGDDYYRCPPFLAQGSGFLFGLASATKAGCRSAFHSFFSAVVASLDGQTPAQVAGVGIEDKNKWLSHAHRVSKRFFKTVNQPNTATIQAGMSMSRAGAASTIQGVNGHGVRHPPPPRCPNSANAQNIKMTRRLEKVAAMNQPALKGIEILHGQTNVKTTLHPP
jgi:hypothetical protein